MSYNEKQRKRMIVLGAGIVVAIASIFIVISRAKEANDLKSEQYDITGLENKTYPSNLADMYQWRTEYIGDNSAVGNITEAWFIDEAAPMQKDGCELQTLTEPYEVTVRYVSDMSENNAYYANMVNLEKDTALLFSLVHNAGIVNISINDQIMGTFTRTDMEEKFGDLWSMSESYEDFCKTYDYISYLQSISASEKEKASLNEVMDRLAETIGTENALPFDNTADILPDKDELIKLCVSQDGKYEAYGCISSEYGNQGIILNNIINGEPNHNYLDDAWHYADTQPELITLNQTQYDVAFIEPWYEGGVYIKRVRYFTGFDTGTVAEKEKPEILRKEEDIFKISITNGDTGEQKEYSRLDSNTGFQNLLSKYEGMMITLSENKAERISGYQYAFKLYDSQDKLLQTFYLQGSEIDVVGDTRYQEAGLGSINELYLVADSMFKTEAAEAAFTSQTDQKEPKEVSGVQMIVTYSTDSTANVIFTNITEVEFLYGNWFRIDKKENGQWQTAIADDSLMFDDIGYNLSPGGIGIWQVNWSNIYGKLPAGEYRIVKSIDNTNISHPQNENALDYIGADFTVQ